ncbi:MAG: portal protein, partial [Nocardiaceae bacterium]|nr:portal protein [Nocardiaceae bacterium]
LMDLPDEVGAQILVDPDKPVPVIQCEVYHPDNKHYYGIVVHESTKSILWRYDYGQSCPKIVTRATKVAGELYGRGRAMLALSDAKTLDKVTEFILRHAALQVAPPMTGVSDGVLNPWTATLQPNKILPVASNDNGNPSLRVLEIGGNFQIGEVLVENLRNSLRRKMLGPDMSDGAIKSATEISVSDRNRLWAMGGEYARIQYEGLAKIVARGVFILQRKGLIPKFKINGREVALKYTSPFAKSQASEDINALLRMLQVGDLMSVGPETVKLGIKVEDIPAWVARKEGVDEDLIRSPDEKAKVMDQATQAAAAIAEAPDAAATPEAPAE